MYDLAYAEASIEYILQLKCIEAIARERTPDSKKTV